MGHLEGCAHLVYFNTGKWLAFRSLETFPKRLPKMHVLLALTCSDVAHTATPSYDAINHLNAWNWGSGEESISHVNTEV